MSSMYSRLISFITRCRPGCCGRVGAIAFFCHHLESPSYCLCSTFPPRQGIDSQYIKYCEEESGYVLDPRLRLGLKQREMVTEMLEMGWLFTSVVRYNQTIDGEDTP